jgi:hypothetical protein
MSQLPPSPSRPFGWRWTQLSFERRGVASILVVIVSLAGLALPQPIRGVLELLLGLGAPLVAFSYCLPPGKMSRGGFALAMTIASWCLLSLVVYVEGLSPSGWSSVFVLALVLAGALLCERMTSHRSQPSEEASPPSEEASPPTTGL